MIPEPWRTLLRAAVGSPSEIDRITGELRAARPELFHPVRCDSCIRRVFSVKRQDFRCNVNHEIQIRAHHCADWRGKPVYDVS